MGRQRRQSTGLVGGGRCRTRTDDFRLCQGWMGRQRRQSTRLRLVGDVGLEPTTSAL